MVFPLVFPRLLLECEKNIVFLHICSLLDPLPTRDEKVAFFPYQLVFGWAYFRPLPKPEFLGPWQMELDMVGNG